MKQFNRQQEPQLITDNYRNYLVGMKNLFVYVKSFSFRDYWSSKNPNYPVPDIDKFECVRECYNDYIYTDGNYFYVLDSNDNCIEMHHNLDGIKTILTEKKTITM